MRPSKGGSTKREAQHRPQHRNMTPSIGGSIPPLPPGVFPSFSACFVSPLPPGVFPPFSACSASPLFPGVFPPLPPLPKPAPLSPSLGKHT